MDLGTARGKVKVDADTKGVGKAEKDLTGLDRAFKIVAKAAEVFEKGLNKMERELNQASADMREADRQAGNLDSSIRRADRSTLAWSESLRGLHERLKGVNSAAQTAGPALLQIGKIGLEFRKTQGGTIGFFQAFTRAGAAGTAIDILKGKFFGLSAAMAFMPAWTKQIVQFTNTFRLFTFGIGVLTAFAAKTGILGRIGVKVFDAIATRSEFAGLMLAKMGSKISPLAPLFKKLGRYIVELNGHLDNTAKGIVQTVAGFALMQHGIRGLIARFQFLLRMSPKIAAIVGGAFASLPAAIELGAASLRTFSNAIMLVVDAAKQLSGGFLAIPGAITMMVTAIGTLKVLFGGLKKAFEDVFKAKTPEEMMAAIDALPEHLKPIGKVLGEIIPKWKEIGTEMQKTFVIGAENQLKALSDTFLPAVRQGVLPLVNAFRQVKDEIVGFAAQGESVSFVKQAFQNTAQTVLQLKDALIPLLAGLRDIASVGMTFIRDMSGGAETLTQKFADWAKTNRENGNLMRWMKEAVAGIKDLWSGLKDATQALWALLTLFATDTGDNALERFADAMEKFNNAVQKSKADGILRQIGDAVKSMQTEKIKQLWDVFRSLGDALKEVIPFVVEASKAFGEVFFPALKLTLELIEQLTAVLRATGMDKFLGVVLGLVAAWKTLNLVLGPMRNIIQTVVGAFNFFKGAETLILGAAGALEKFGPAGKKASDAILGVGDKIKGVLGGVGITAAIGLAFKEFYDAGADQIDNMKAKVQELNDFTENMGKEIASNIIDEGTLQNASEVFGSTIDEMMTKMQEAADSAPGMAGAFTDAMRAVSEQPRIAGARFQAPAAPAHTAEFEQGKKAAENAKLAKEAIDKLGMSTDDLNEKVTGTAEGFNTFIASLESSGEGGRLAAENFKTLRAEWEALQQAGEGGVKIAHGIDAIADSAGDATSKLEGLKSALEGAGLLQTTQLDAAFAYAESIREIANATDEVVDRSQPLNDILDAQTGLYNVNSVNASNLRNALQGLEADYLAAVANGGDATAEWEKQQPVLQKLADQFNLPIEKVRQLAALEGGLPDEIKLLLTAEGADEVQQDVIGAVLKAQSAAKDQPVTIPIEGDVDQVKTAIEGLLGPGSVIAQTDSSITLGANIDDAKLQSAIATLNAAGISLPGHPATGGPAQINVEVAPADRRGKGPAPTGPEVKPLKPEEAPVIEAGPAGPPKPQVAVTPAEQATLDQAKTTIEDIKKSVEELNGQEIKLKISEFEKIDEAKTRIDELFASMKDKELLIRVTLEGLDQFQAGMDQIKAGISNSMMQWNNYKIAVVQAFRDIVTAFDAAMQALQQKMDAAGATNQQRGLKFGQDFAQGIRDSIPAIEQAATDAAAAAADRMPGSPAKKGPLSGRGWSRYGGIAFAEDFAAGIAEATAGVGEESDAMAERATASMAGRAESFQGFMAGLIRVLDIASQAIGVVQEIFGHIQQTFQIVQDIMKPPEKKAAAEEEHGRRAGRAPGPLALPGAEGLRGITEPSKEQIAAAIIGEAQKRGYGRDVAIGAIATGMLESGLDAVIENATGHKGIFQMDKAKPGRDSALGQITWFFDQLDALGAREAEDPLALIATEIEKGGYGPEAIAAFTDEAAMFYDRVIGSLDDNTDAVSRNSTSFKAFDRALLANVPTGRYAQTGAADLTKGLGDCSSAIEDLINLAEGRPTGGRQMSTANAAEWLTSRGFRRGAGGPGDFRVAFNVNHMQATLPGGTNFNWGSEAAAAAGGLAKNLGAADPALTERFYRSSLNGDQAAMFADEVSSTDLSVYDQPGEQAQYDTQAVTESANNDLIRQLRDGNKDLDEAIKTGEDPTRTDEEQLQALTSIDKAIAETSGDQFDQNKEQVNALQGVRNAVAAPKVAEEPETAMDQAAASFGQVMEIAGGAMSIAQDIIGLMKTTIETIGMVKQSMDLLVRGIENTEQINVLIDTIQKFIELAAKMAQTVSDITGMIAGFTGKMDFGATAAVSAIAGMISGILTTINAVIDLTQEAWHIFGSYFGQFLGFLAGAGDQLEGDVKFLLDQNDKTLKAYSRGNPEVKATHPMAGEMLTGRPDLVGPQIGSITVFGGPGQDPRDTTRNMMFAVKSAAMGATYAQ